MTDKPILFSGPMVRAILDGRKTQTRRALNPQPKTLRHCDNCGLWEGEWAACEEPDCGKLVETMQLRKPTPIAKGDHLYVREAWADVNYCGAPAIALRADHCIDELMDHEDFLRADSSMNYEDERITGFGKHGLQFTMWYQDLFNGEPDHAWKPGIHMPKWASRIWLRVTDVRVQRLQDISDQDALAEGTPRIVTGSLGDEDQLIEDFAYLWDSLNAKRGFGWDANPWVAAYTFERIERPEL